MKLDGRYWEARWSNEIITLHVRATIGTSIVKFIPSKSARAKTNTKKLTDFGG